MFDPVDDQENYKWNAFYYNPADPRIRVPKRTRMLGWTLNFAHKESYLICVVLLVCIFLITFGAVTR